MRTMTEQEDKFDVDSDWVMPPLAELVPERGRLDQEVRKLDNTYFDTPGAGLRLFGITLRRRVGGSETGWQLKIPSGTAKTELQSGSRAKTLPPALVEGVEGLRAGESLDPVAKLRRRLNAPRVFELGLVAPNDLAYRRARYQKRAHDLLDGAVLLEIGAPYLADLVHANHPHQPFPADQGQKEGR